MARKHRELSAECIEYSTQNPPPKGGSHLEAPGHRPPHQALTQGGSRDQTQTQVGQGWGVAQQPPILKNYPLAQVRQTNNGVLTYCIVLYWLDEEGRIRRGGDDGKNTTPTLGTGGIAGSVGREIKAIAMCIVLWARTSNKNKGVKFLFCLHVKSVAGRADCIINSITFSTE